MYTSCVLGCLSLLISMNPYYLSKKKKKKKKVLEREQTYLMRKDPAMVDYNVDKIEVAISGLFSLEVVAELRVERGHGFYVLNRGLLIQRAELSESHCEQQ